MAMSRLNFLIVFLLLTLTLTVYAQKNEDIYSEEWLKSQAEKTDSKDSAEKKNNFFAGWFNSQAFASPADTNKEKLREDWKEFLGVDIFYPYFKAKEVENYVKEKTSVDFLNMKGRPEFDEGSNQIRYIFKKKF